MILTKAEEKGITRFPYREWDIFGNLTYYEDDDGWWEELKWGDYKILEFEDYHGNYWTNKMSNRCPFIHHW
jgi:hypothetical protein